MKKETKQETNQETKPKKAEKKEAVTLVSLIKAVAQKQHNNRKEVVSEVLVLAKKNGVTKTARGTVITDGNITSLMAAMCRDIKNEKGKSKLAGGKNSWWADWEVVEDEKQFIMRPKAKSA